MSAVFGIVRWDGQPVDVAAVERMGRLLAHRGPDARRIVEAAPAAFGHALMRVNGEDWLEAQPLCDPDGAVMLAADLRLDNREALAAALGIAPEALAAMADSALLLAAYRAWGEGCVERLVGDFAFAIWDGRTRRLLLARDHMGQRGLFYHRGAGFLAFASEMRALWAVEEVPRRLSERAIGRALLHPIDPDRGATPWEGIAVLPGATLLGLALDGTISTRRYWSPRADPAHEGQDEEYYRRTYRTLLEESVACRLRRLIRPPALLFSGGFDSGGIAALAGPIVAGQGRRLIAVASVLAEGERRAVRDARSAVEAFRDRSFLDIRYFVRSDETRFTAIESSFAATGLPSGTDYVRAGLYRIAAEAGARLVMDGHGGDYTVNVRAPAMLGRILRRGEVSRFLREFSARQRATGRSARQVLAWDVVRGLLPLGALRLAAAIGRGGRPVWRSRAVQPRFARALAATGAIDLARLRQPSAVRNRWRDRWLHLLDKVSAGPPAQVQAAASGLELTRPYHDKRVVEFALAIPESLQLRDGLERHLARCALGDLLPAALLARGPGNDQEDPDMFRAARDSAADALAEARALDRDGRISRYVDLDAVERMIAGPDERRLADHRRIQAGLRALVVARFIAWADNRNG